MKLTADNLILSCWWNGYSVDNAKAWLQALGFMVNETAIRVTFAFHDKNTKRSEIKDTLDMHELL